MSKIFLILSLFFVPPLHVFAETPRVVLEELSETFVNDDCTESGSCSLKGAHFSAHDYRVKIDGLYHYGTRLYASYETDSVETLEDYVFVQFIRGCAYVSKEQGDGTYAHRFYIDRDFFGDNVRFKHPEWVIDSMDKDPVYASSYGYERHASYRWNTDGDPSNKETLRAYAWEKPPKPRLYVIDYPMQAVYLPKDKRAYSVSLEFIIAVYKETDVPEKTTPENTDFAEPIHSFAWTSSFVFNPKTKTFERLKGIAPICISP